MDWIISYSLGVDPLFTLFITSTYTELNPRSDQDPILPPPPLLRTKPTMPTQQVDSRYVPMKKNGNHFILGYFARETLHKQSGHISYPARSHFSPRHRHVTRCVNRTDAFLHYFNFESNTIQVS